MLPVDTLACRYGRLVYVRTLKCASSFYYGNLTMNYGWTPMAYRNIDWEHDHVFSHVMDPVTRNLKGKLEHLLITGQENLLSSAKFLMFVRDICFFDEHSISYQDVYGDRRGEIDWIPLKASPTLEGRPGVLRSNEDFERLMIYDRVLKEYHQESMRLTENLINHFEPQHPAFDRWNSEFARPADNRMLNLFRVLQEDNLRRDLIQSNLGQYLSADIELFHLIMEKFNPRGASWPEVTWLK